MITINNKREIIINTCKNFAGILQIAQKHNIFKGN